MIELDKWESQLVYLSKRALEYSAEININYKDALKNLWGERQCMHPKHVDLGYVGGALVDLVQKVVPGLNLKGFLSNLAPFQYFEVKYTDNASYAERICWVCLYNYLSILQVREKDENDNWYDIISLMPFEPELFKSKEDE